MEKLTANLIGNIRYETLNGLKYVVAPMRLIVSGVLNGSQGPLLYPKDELTKNIEAWNGVPIVVYHPTRNSQPVSARDPEVINSQGVGFVFRAAYKEDKEALDAEAWIGVDAAKRIDNRILTAVENGKKLEISTGLFTDNTPASEGAKWSDNKPYSFVATNYRPDHLALLPDQVGACSLEDGCGLNVNEETSNKADKEEDIPMAKQQLIDDLIANSSCWCKDHQEVLNNFEESQLEALVKEAKKSKANGLIANAATKGFEDEGGNLHAFDSKKGAWETVLKEKEKEKEPAPTANKEEGQEVKPLTEDEWLKAAPPSVQNAFQHAQRIEQRERDAAIQKIVANVTDTDQRQRLVSTLSNKPLEELADLQLLAVNNKPEPQDSPLFFGAAGGPPATNNEQHKEEPLPLPTINWSSN